MYELYNVYLAKSEFLQVRRLFKRPKLLSEILGIDEDLIIGISNVWIALKSNEPLDALEFGMYCSQLADLYEGLYPTMEMCQSLHRILRHGWMLVEATPETLSLGQYSEEGGEANNKYIKAFMLQRSRQCTRQYRLSDTFQRLMDTSDPVGLSKREKKLNKKKPKYPEAVVKLFKSSRAVLDFEEFVE